MIKTESDKTDRGLLCTALSFSFYAGTGNVGGWVAVKAGPLADIRYTRAGRRRRKKKKGFRPHTQAIIPIIDGREYSVLYAARSILIERR